jgi:hypothetical protein
LDFQRLSVDESPPQKWIDSNLPTCPLCREPGLWSTATTVDQQALVRWYFKCSNCKVVLSSIPNKPVSAVAEPVTIVKAAVTDNLRIESVERKSDEDFVGEEFPLYELQQWAEETDG